MIAIRWRLRGKCFIFPKFFLLLSRPIVASFWDSLYSRGDEHVRLSTPHQPPVSTDWCPTLAPSLLFSSVSQIARWLQHMQTTCIHALPARTYTHGPPTQGQLERHSFGSAPWEEAQRRTERQQPSARTGSLLFNVQSRSTCKVSTPLQLDPEIIASAQVNQRNRGVNRGPAVGRLLSEVRGRDDLFEANVEVGFSLKRNHLSTMIGPNRSNDPFVMKIYNYNLSLNLRNYLPNMHILWKDCKSFCFCIFGDCCYLELWLSTKLRFASLFLQTKVGSC